jgi:uncharacterized damage-inducible protein DinB
MWHFLDGAPAAQSEKRVLELLNHIHAVQRFFLSAAQGAPLTREEVSKQLGLAELRQSYGHYHAAALEFLASMPQGKLNEAVVVPWFPESLLTVYVALVQAATHSIHHRAQIATLIRQHGGNPKPTDFIVWCSKGRPAAEWRVEAAKA